MSSYRRVSHIDFLSAMGIISPDVHSESCRIRKEIYKDKVQFFYDESDTWLTVARGESILYYRFHECYSMSIECTKDEEVLVALENRGPSAEDGFTYFLRLHMGYEHVPRYSRIIYLTKEEAAIATLRKEETTDRP